MRLLLLLLLLLPAAADPARDWCQQVERQVAETGEYGPYWVNELKVNARQHPWPAVGRYERTFRFYYDRREGSYPDQLRCVQVEAATSDRSYAETLIYDAAGRLVLYRGKDELLFWNGQLR